MESLVDLVPSVEHYIFIIIAITAFLSILKAFGAMPSFGQLRVMGVTLALYLWIQVIFWLSLGQAGFGIVTTIFNLPWWIDITLSLIIFVISVIIYTALSSRSTFKPEPFFATVFLPLGICVGNLTQAGIESGILHLNPGSFWNLVPEVLRESPKILKPKIRELEKVTIKEAPKIPGLKSPTVKETLEKIEETHPIAIPQTNRPVWLKGKEFEEYLEKKLGDGYRTQVTFKEGKEVPYGTKGATRPDFYKVGESIEAKSYDILTAEGQKNLIHDVTVQAIERSKELPSGTTQKLSIDVRGQKVDRITLESMVEKIVSASNGVFQAENIEFLR